MLKNGTMAVLVCLIWGGLVMSGLLYAEELPEAVPQSPPEILEAGLSEAEQEVLAVAEPLPRAVAEEAEAAEETFLPLPEPEEPEPEPEPGPDPTVCERILQEVLVDWDFPWESGYALTGAEAEAVLALLQGTQPVRSSDHSALARQAYQELLQRTAVEIEGLTIFTPLDYQAFEQQWGSQLAYASLAELVAALGRPQTVALGADYIFDTLGLRLDYDFGSFWLVNYGSPQEPNYAVHSCTLTGPEVVGPRGVRLGDSLEAVQALFPRMTDFGDFELDSWLTDPLYIGPGSRMYATSGRLEDGSAGWRYLIYSYAEATTYLEEDGQERRTGDYCYLIFDFYDGELAQIRIGDPTCC